MAPHNGVSLWHEVPTVGADSQPKRDPDNVHSPRGPEIVSLWFGQARLRGSNTPPAAAAEGRGGSSSFQRAARTVPARVAPGAQPNIEAGRGRGCRNYSQSPADSHFDAALAVTVVAAGILFAYAHVQLPGSRAEEMVTRRPLFLHQAHFALNPSG